MIIVLGAIIAGVIWVTIKITATTSLVLVKSWQIIGEATKEEK